MAMSNFLWFLLHNMYVTVNYYTWLLIAICNYVQSSLDIPGFSGETKNARYIEGHGISRDPFSGAKFQSKSLNFYIFNAYC